MVKDEKLKILQAQIKKLSPLPFYQKRFREAGMKPEDMPTWADFQKILLMDTKDLQRDLEEYPPKEKLRQALGPIGLIDSYGLGQSTPVARQCQEERGLHVADNLLYLKTIHPEPGQVLPDGERGEVVITHLCRQGSPLLLFRTGDLGLLEDIEFSCGRRATLTKGVLGRTDEMPKVKGVKLYPSQIDHLLRTLPQYNPGRYQVKLRSKTGGGDLFLITVEGKDLGPKETEKLI